MKQQEVPEEIWVMLHSMDCPAYVQWDAYRYKETHDEHKKKQPKCRLVKYVPSRRKP